jgi:signal transduction histidine kinase
MARLAKNSSGYTILVVDDQEETLRSTRRLLEREGHRVLLSSSGSEALELFRLEQPQLLVIDYFMPGMTGEELITCIRQENDTVQILLQTGYSGEKPARQMLDDLDIQGYHDKSDGADRLLVWVRVCLKAHRQLQRVREAERLKGELLNNMSHEFRTPLNITLGYFEMLMEGACGALPDEATQTLQRVEDNTRALLSLVDDLLDVAKLETQAAEARFEAVALSTVRADAEMVIDRMSGARGVRLHWDAQDDAVTVRADRQKLELVLSQILSTAADATSTGEVWVRARENGPDVLFLVVSGSGPDAATALDSSFAAAAGEGGDRVDADLETVALAVARRVARTMNGDLGVIRTQSAEKAVLLSLRLPRAVAEDPAAAVRPAATAPATA